MSYSTAEAENELEKQVNQFRNVITARAILLAHKEGKQTITSRHIEKISKRAIVEENNKEKIILIISTVVLVGLAFFQLSITYSQIHLCLLPLFSLLWTTIVITTLRDSL